MATALVDLYGGSDFGPFDRIILAEGYHPSDAEEFMCGKHRAYFLRKLRAWKEDIIEESRQTMAQLQVDSLREPDLADRASSETDWSIELRTRDRQRKLIAKIDCAIRRLYEGEYGYCEVSGEPISLARLEARPVATMTLEAQERHERIGLARAGRRGLRARVRAPDGDLARLARRLIAPRTSLAERARGVAARAFGKFPLTVNANERMQAD